MACFCNARGTSCPAVQKERGYGEETDGVPELWNLCNLYRSGLSLQYPSGKRQSKKKKTHFAEVHSTMATVKHLS